MPFISWLSSTCLFQTYSPFPENKKIRQKRTRYKDNQILLLFEQQHILICAAINTRSGWHLP